MSGSDASSLGRHGKIIGNSKVPGDEGVAATLFCVGRSTILVGCQPQTGACPQIQQTEVLNGARLCEPQHYPNALLAKRLRVTDPRSNR